MRRRLRLVAGLPRDELIRRITYHARRKEVSQRALGFYLLDMEGRGEYRPEAKSMEDWAVKKLGYDLRVLREIVATAKALEELPRTDAQLSRGRISWTTAKLVSEVATGKTERAWLRCARRHSYAELRAAVRKAKGRKGPRPGDGLDCERPAYTIQYRVRALDHEVFERALKKMRWEIGPEATPAEGLRRMAELALKAPPPPGKLSRDPSGPKGEGAGETPVGAMAEPSPQGAEVARREVPRANARGAEAAGAGGSLDQGAEEARARGPRAPSADSASDGSTQPVAASPRRSGTEPTPRELFGFLVVIHADKEGLWIFKEDENGQPIRERISAEELDQVIRSGARVVVALPPRGDNPERAIRFGEKGSLASGRSERYALSGRGPEYARGTSQRSASALGAGAG